MNHKPVHADVANPDRGCTGAVAAGTLLRARKNAWAERVTRMILGIVFIWASWHKIVSPDQFAKILFGYGVFPGDMINLMAIGVPFVEMVSGLCLISGCYKRPALILINAMLAGFILVIAYNLIRGHEFDCGCFSFGDTKGFSSAVELLVRDIVMLGAGMVLLTRFNKEP